MYEYVCQLSLAMQGESNVPSTSSLQAKDQQSLQCNVQSISLLLHIHQGHASAFGSKVVLAFLQCLVCNKASPAVLANYVSGIKAKCILYDLSYNVCENAKIKYFLKSVKLNRPLCVKHH